MNAVSSIEELCAPRPTKRPSETGLSVSELARGISIKSRERALMKFREFLEECRSSDNPLAAFVVAEWGEGKTSLFYLILDPLRPPEAVGFIVSARTVMGYLEEAIRGGIFPKSKSLAYLLLASMLSALREEQIEAVKIKCSSSGIELPSPHEYESAEQFVRDTLSTLFTACRADRVYLFVDEFEDIVTASSRDLVESVISGLTHLLNGNVVEISTRSDTGRGEFAGRLHVIISLTPSAYSKLRSFGDLSTTIARLGRRVKIVELKPLKRSEAYAFIEALAGYIFGSETDLRSVFNSLSLLNPIIIATLGNMAAIQRAFTELVYGQLSRAPCGEGMRRIGYEDLIELLPTIQIHIAGADLPLMFEDLVKKIESQWSRYASMDSSLDPSKSLEILRYLIANVLVDPERMVRDLELRAVDVESTILALNAFVRGCTALSSSRRFVYRVKVVAYSEDLATTLEDVFVHALRLTPSTHSSARELASMLVEALTLVDDSLGLSIALPPTDVAELRDLLRDSIPVQMSDVEYERLASFIARRVAESVQESGGVRYMVSPRVLSLVYLSPELTFLEFVRDIDRRFRYWRELIASIPSEFLELGIVSMLSCLRDVRVRSVEVV